MPTANGNHRARSAASAPTPRRTAAKAPAHTARSVAGAQKASGVRAPINAASAAKRAAHARPGEEGKLRVAAAGTARSARRDASARGSAAMGGGGKMMYIAIVVGAVLAALVFFFVGRALLGAFMSDGEQETVTAVSEKEQPVDNASSAGEGDELPAVTYGTTVYSARVDDDGFTYVTRSSVDAPDESLDLFACNGDLVGMAYCQGVLYTVCNVDGSCEVAAYVDGDGSVPVIYRETEGAPASVTLDGTKLTITYEDGSTNTIELGVAE